jgi:hypothetical protein
VDSRLQAAAGRCFVSPEVSRSLLLAAIFFLLLRALATAEEGASGIYNPLHAYFTQEPNDRFSRLKADLAAGRRTLETSGELALLQSLLRELEVPVASQTLVFSVTSLQKPLISPRRPRALYFNDDTYVGYVPGGRIEVIATDPQLGCTFYIFDRFTGSGVPSASRSSECMNCHAPAYIDNVPGLMIESVVPGITGGGEKAFRRRQSGHAVPLDLRFGGWHVTGAGKGWPRTWGNLLIEYRNGQAIERPIAIGELFDREQYLLSTSDLLPQLVQEHQVGFVNRALQAAYRARELVSAKPDDLEAQLAELAKPVVRYLLFAEEVPLPAPVAGDPGFKAAFLANRRRATSTGLALKDFDLRTRLFRHRCSYMIYTPTFQGLPAPLKLAILRQLNRALAETPLSPEYAYLPPAEKRAIRTILTETVPGFPYRLE